MVPKKVAFVSSFLPRKCGIATFTADLIRNAGAAGEKNFVPLVVAVENAPHTYDDRVTFKIKQEAKPDYIAAAEYLNFSGATTISLQHEFGLFGGDAGNYINLLLNKVSAPIATTFHTILEQPSDTYFQELVAIATASDRVVAMSHRAERVLQNLYGIPSQKIVFIPHGSPDIGFVDTKHYKQALGVADRTLVFTFGLLARNKGIEYAISAIAEIVEEYPSVLYVVAGVTHPEVVKSEGEAYRLSLMRLVEELKLERNVVFVDRFLSDAELRDYLSAADIYLTPYLVKEQAISGTLSFALGAGKAIVSTPYWYAEELLAEERGAIVPFRDSNAIAGALRTYLKDPAATYGLRERAYELGRSMTWTKAGGLYWDLFSRYSSHPTIKIKSFEIEAVRNVPQPLTNHLLRLTDDTGIFQHAKFIIPDRESGYCTDDNARALEAAALYYHQYREREVLRLFNIYLSFVSYAQTEAGTFRNFMSFERRFVDREGMAGDQGGRALAALGTVIVHPPLPQYLFYAREKFDKSLPAIRDFSLRGKAHAIVGLAHYLSAHPEKDDLRTEMIAAADAIAGRFEQNASDEWEWFEEILSYDSGILPRALFEAALTLNEDRYLDAATKSMLFLLSKTFNGKWFSFVGSNGWYPRGGTKAAFDQQAVEAASTVQMLGAAYRVNRDPTYLDLQRIAFNWFLGVNDKATALYDFTTHGCYDGLHETGVNLNQGAESLLSYLLALFGVIESSTAPLVQ